jgi:hypothetical protein
LALLQLPTSELGLRPYNKAQRLPERPNTGGGTSKPKTGAGLRSTGCTLSILRHYMPLPNNFEERL